ncbi:DNA replication and repair protein RecF [Marinilabiliaceae bacterium ANBcel2]|nr:DNA replication and repair protein RecF [Marinilabiliaceae bacterium ANBcel2]
MYIEHLNVLNFKNIGEATLDLCNGINCFVGDNGAGKTNLIDSVYYLSFCKSYFNPIDSQLIRHKNNFFVIQGKYKKGEYNEYIYAGIKRNQKKQFKRNKKEYSRLSDHIGLLPLVIISPGDERLINEGGEQRRKYIDSVISQFDKDYLTHLIRYNKSIIQRNALLKKSQGNLNVISGELEIWDNQLLKNGKIIYNKRREFVNSLLPVFKKYYSIISGNTEDVNILYHSHYDRDDFDKQLVNVQNKDAILGYTTKGVHRDDLELLLDDYPVKKTGSQGQKKSFFVALKLAQFEFLMKHFGFSPMLLLDDLFDKLDNQRSAKLIELVSKDIFQQIFITDTQKHRLVDIVKKTGKKYFIFDVKNGVVKNEISR